MRITIFFRRTKGKQVIYPSDAFLFTNTSKGGTRRLSHHEVESKVKDLVYDVSQGDMVDFAFEVF